MQEMAAVWDSIEAQADSMLLDVVMLAEHNSGSFNTDGLAVTASVISEFIGRLDLDVTLIDLEPMTEINAEGANESHALGRLIGATNKQAHGFSVLLVSHYDTVFGPKHHFQTTSRAGDQLRGPGVADDKGGIVIMLAALRALAEADMLDFGFEILLNPDEELGSPGSREHLRQAAQRHDAGLVFEPSLPGGLLASRRKGSGTFSVVVRGRAAHAGRDHHLGRNAVIAATHVAQRLAGLTGMRDELTVNVSQIDGGTAVNIVPDVAVVRANARVADEDGQKLVETTVAALAEELSHDGITVEAHGGFGRPPKLVTRGIEELFEHARAEASDLGFELEWQATGGVCDGNDLAAAGLPNLDNMGPVGGDLHSSDEWVSIESFTERAKLAAGLLRRLSREGLST